MYSNEDDACQKCDQVSEQLSCYTEANSLMGSRGLDWKGRSDKHMNTRYYITWLDSNNMWHA